MCYGQDRRQHSNSAAGHRLEADKQKKLGCVERPLFFCEGVKGASPLRTDLCKRSSELDLAEIFVPMKR